MDQESSVQTRAIHDGFSGIWQPIRPGDRVSTAQDDGFICDLDVFVVGSLCCDRAAGHQHQVTVNRHT